MKHLLKTLCLFGALFMALLFSSGFVYAQEQDDVDPQACPVVDEMENYRMAGEILRKAEAQEDVWLAIAAARMLNDIPGGILLPQSPSEAKFSKSATAKLDDQTGKAAARRLVNHALKLANKLAGDDEKLKAEISALGSAESKWYSYTCYTYNDLGASFYWTAPSLQAARGNAMNACRYYTPYGYSCYYSHCN